MTQPTLTPTITDDNPLTAATVETVKSYVDSPEWVARMESWGEGYADLTRTAILKAISQGAGPRAVASKMRQYAENLPGSAAESLTRTLQLTAYRENSLAMEKINGEFIQYKIRLCALTNTSCLSCIALHGTRLEVGERVDDHYNGMCSEFYVVPGGGLPEFMQADSTPGNRQFVPFQTGEDWFASLSPERQAQQAAFQNSPAMLAAFNSGVPLSAFVGEHQDDVFGRMVVQQSLAGAIGEEAAKGFYK